MKTTLSLEEIETQKSYKFIAQSRNRTHADPEFWRAEFEEFRKMLPDGNIIDVGCGAGRDALLLKSGGYKYVGVDLSPEMLVQAKALVPDGNFQEMNMYSLNYPRDYFDGFWAAASLLHIPKNKVPEALSEIHRVVQHDGIGFIAIKEGEGEKVIQGPLDGDKRFFSFYHKEEFTRVLTHSDFEVLTEHRSNVDLNPPKNVTVWLTYLVRVCK